MWISIIMLAFCGTVVVKSSCKEGWEEFDETGSCYMVGTNAETWNNAQKFCKTAGGHLARIECSSENIYIKSKARSVMDDVWVDGTDIAQEGVWIYDSTQTPLCYTDWYQGQPDNTDHNQHCLALNHQFDYKWDDNNCSIEKLFICEIDSLVNDTRIVCTDDVIEEQTQTPRIEILNNPTFIFDFSTNYTTVVSAEMLICYVMDLDREKFKPPKDFQDLLTGNYKYDLDYLRTNYRIQTPAIEDASYFGANIEQECFGYPTFKLEKITTESTEIRNIRLHSMHDAHLCPKRKQ